MENMLAGALIGKKRNTILARSKELWERRRKRGCWRASDQRDHRHLFNLFKVPFGLTNTKTTKTEKLKWGMWEFWVSTIPFIRDRQDTPSGLVCLSGFTNITQTKNWGCVRAEELASISRESNQEAPPRERERVRKHIRFGRIVLDWIWLVAVYYPSGRMTFFRRRVLPH